MNYFKKNKIFYDINRECSYIVNGDDLFISTEQGLFVYSLKKDKLEILINKKIYWFSILKNQVIYQLENGEDLFGLWNNNKKEGKYYLSSSILFGDNALILDKKNENTKLYETILLCEDFSIKPINLTYFPDKIIDNNTYTYIALNTLFVYTFNNQLLWQHSFSDLLEGEKIVQVGDTIIYKDFLYLCLKDSENEKNNATFCIEIETGKVVNMYKGFYGFLFLKDDNIYTSYIYSVKKLSLISGEITEYSFENILKPKDLKIHWDKSIVKNNKLYFVDFKIYSTNRMGVIDMEKCELIWQKDFEINDGINNNIQEIRLVENRLYVHCSDNTLHILEKDENS